MIFRYAAEIPRRFPELVTVAIRVTGIDNLADIQVVSELYTDEALKLVSENSESSLAQVQAWRRVFSDLGLKPTQYRCASEALLRRLRKEGRPPSFHPMVDLCNSISMAFATPVAAFDLSKVDGVLEVRHALGTELYETFAKEIEYPDPGEVIFADESGRAHARRWTNKQSFFSAIQAATTDALIVAEALHPSAREDAKRLSESLCTSLRSVWPKAVISEVMSP
jgi:DNA/RNA-binding domain of Phe-tRNA-synthetase-like protein